jgi:ATP-dependent Clp protease adaptor protein ClpS
MVKEKTQHKTKIQKDILKELILYNDDVNSFDFVIETLIEICEHDSLQAEQCALITHFKGKCTVKSGTNEFLLPYCNSLHERGLSAEIS